MQLRHRLLGIAVFAAGIVIAMLRLPEWRNLRGPERDFFAARLQQAARQAGLDLESAPRAELRSKGWLYEDESLGQHETAYTTFGPAAADWLTGEGRGPFVETTARSRLRGDNGEMRLLFSLRGVPVSAMWTPDDPLRTVPSAERDAKRAAVVRMFEPPGLSAPETAVGLFGSTTLHLAPVLGSAPPESLIATSMNGTTPYVHRVVGTAGWWHDRLERMSVGSVVAGTFPRLVVRSLLYVLILLLFVLFLARRQIELTRGAILGAVSVALSVAGLLGISGPWLQLSASATFVVGKGVALLVLWSAAESWLRWTVPGFRTSLDTLSAGRLGPSGGRALLDGWSIGAAVAGIWLAALALGTAVLGIAPTDASVHVPLFGVSLSPIDDGVVRSGIVIVAICAALRLPLIRRIRGSSTAIAGLALATWVPISSFWFAIAVGVILAAVLVRAYASLGLTALVAAAMTSAVLPAALFSLLHGSWLTSPAVLLTAIAVAPLVLGLIGVRRPAEVEEGLLPVPAFVRRLEEESRVKYEMELLTRMQLGLLPKETPRIDGYEIAAQSILATEAGGDLYDFVRDARGRIWIAAGDVSGHGYSCAIAQAMTKAGLASLVEAERTPAVVLERLHQVLLGIGSPRTFTSLALLRLDPADGEALLSNAGHPYPWIARNGEVRELEIPSLPLGQGPARQYVDAPLSMEVGTALVFSSDGLYEGADAHGRPYGFDRMRQLLGRVSALPASAILAAIVEDWRGHVGVEAPADDTTIVVVKRL